MVSIDYIDGQGWHDARGAAVRPDRARPVGHRAALRAGDLRGAQGLPLGRRLDRVVPAGGQRGAAALVGAPAGHPGAARGAVHRVAAPADRRRRRSGCRPPAARSRCTCGRSSSPPSPASGVRPAIRVPLPGDRLAGRRVLQGRHQAGQRVAVAPSTCGPAPAAPARPSSAATTPPRCSRRPRPPRTAATRWCGWTPSNAATSRRWAG